MARDLTWEERIKMQGNQDHQVVQVREVIKYSTYIYSLLKQTKEIVSLFKGEALKCSVLVQIT